jgi:hypothetical protein
MNVKITTRTVGGLFATEGQVRNARTGRILHTTRLMPYGCVNAAMREAEDWVIESGHDIEVCEVQS